MEQPSVTCIHDIPGQNEHTSIAAEGAQGENDCPVGSIGASMVGLLGVGKGVFVGVANWVGWLGG